MLLIIQQSQVIRGSLDTMGTMHTRLFNFIRFELASSDTGQSSHFLDMTSTRVAMRAFCRTNKAIFKGLRAQAINLRSSTRRAHRSPQEYAKPSISKMLEIIKIGIGDGIWSRWCFFDRFFLLTRALEIPPRGMPEFPQNLQLDPQEAYRDEDEAESNTESSQEEFRMPRSSSSFPPIPVLAHIAENDGSEETTVTKGFG